MERQILIEIIQTDQIKSILVEQFDDVITVKIGVLHGKIDDQDDQEREIARDQIIAIEHLAQDQPDKKNQIGTDKSASGPCIETVKTAEDADEWGKDIEIGAQIDRSVQHTVFIAVRADREDRLRPWGDDDQDKGDQRRNGTEKSGLPAEDLILTAWFNGVIK